MSTARPQPDVLAPDGPTAPSPATQRSPRQRFIVGGVALAIVLLAAGVAYWLHARGRVSTDDAFVEARVVQISPKVGGQVIELNVTDNQRVRAGEVLLRIDPRDYAAAAEQARAQVRAAEVEAQRARV